GGAAVPLSKTRGVPPSPTTCPESSLSSRERVGVRGNLTSKLRCAHLTSCADVLPSSQLPLDVCQRPTYPQGKCPSPPTSTSSPHATATTAGPATTMTKTTPSSSSKNSTSGHSSAKSAASTSPTSAAAPAATHYASPPKAPASPPSISPKPCSTAPAPNPAPT